MSKLRITTGRRKDNHTKPRVNFKNFKQNAVKNSRRRENGIKKARNEAEKETVDIVTSPLFTKEADDTLDEITNSLDILKTVTTDEIKSDGIVESLKEGGGKEDIMTKTQCKELIRVYEIHNRKLERYKKIHERFEKLRKEVECMRMQEEKFKREFVSRLWRKYDPIYGIEELGQNSLFKATWASFKPSKRN